MESYVEFMHRNQAQPKYALTEANLFNIWQRLAALEAENERLKAVREKAEALVAKLDRAYNKAAYQGVWENPSFTQEWTDLQTVLSGPAPQEESNVRETR